MSTSPTNPEPNVPDFLQSDLRGVYRGSISVPASLDEHMLGTARLRLSRVERRRRRAWTIVRWAGMAAAVGLAMLVPTRVSTNSQRVAIVSHSGDVNGDGMVDILDAFSLARAARDGDPSVTQAEIAAATAAAVRLGGGA